MADEDKSKEQLIAELAELRRHLAHAEGNGRRMADPGPEPPDLDMKSLVHRSPVVTFMWRPDNGWPVSFVSESVRRYGHIPQDLIGLTRHEVYVAREDLPSFLATFVEAGGSRGSRSLTREYRFLTHAGEARWVRERLWVERDDGGAITCLVGLLTDIHEQRQLEATVREQEQRLSALFEHASQSILFHDLHGRCLDANRAACDYIGYARDELLEMPFDALVSPEAAARAQRLAQGPLQGREVVVENELIGRDGSHLPVVLECRIIDLDDGRAILTVIRDREARPLAVAPPAADAEAVEALQRRVGELEEANRRLQEERETLSAEASRCQDQLRRTEMLLRDVHHRVKNNLQVIASLLGLQAEYIHDERALEAFADSQNRVRAMALVHERVYQSQDIASVDLGAYLRDLSEHLFEALGASADITLELDVEPIPVPMDIAVPCGLLVSELVSNSIKHAFPAGRRGSVRVSAHRRDGQLVLAVADDGVGLPEGLDFRHTDSLGLQLVNILAQQLGAAMEVDTSAGTRFTCTFSLAA